MRFLFVLAVAYAQQSHTPAQRYEMFQKNLAARAAAISSRQFDGVATLEDWKRRRPIVHKQFMEMLGLDPLPARTPLRARITGGSKGDGFRVEKIVFESRPGLYVTGNLYLPEADGVYPPLVYVSGHAPHPAGAKFSYQHHGAWFARHGFVAFVLDTIEFGEIPGIHHGTHNLEMWNWLSLGYNPTAVEVWNAMRALDYLETRREVDRSRAGITGRSGGGAVSWFTAAADDRFQVAAPVHGSWSIGPHVANDTVRENCDCIYFWNSYQLDLPVVGALIAPRPLMIVNATKDGAFPPSGYRPVHEELKRIYALYGVGEKLAAFESETGHEDAPVYRKAANEWLNRWLRGDTSAYVEETLPAFSAERLTVLNGYPANAINEGLHRVFIPTARVEAPASLAVWNKRRNSLLAALREKTFGAFPKATVPFETWRAKDNGWPARYADAYRVEFSTEENIRVTGKLFVPRDGRASHPALIYAKAKDDIVYGIDYDNLLSAFPHHTVLILHPRATDYPMDNFRTAATKMTAALLGGTLETFQLWDILQSVRFLIETEKVDSVSVYGRRHLGGLALHAAAIEPKITRVILDDPPASHWQGPPLLGVLRLTDLSEVAATIAPREIVSLTPFPQAYRFTEGVFRLHGAKLREANSLAEALQVWK